LIAYLVEPAGESSAASSSVWPEATSPVLRCAFTHGDNCTHMQLHLKALLCGLYLTAFVDNRFDCERTVCWQSGLSLESAHHLTSHVQYLVVLVVFHDMPGELLSTARCWTVHEQSQTPEIDLLQQ
jgi:hypothetical protein